MPYDNEIKPTNQGGEIKFGDNIVLGGKEWKLVSPISAGANSSVSRIEDELGNVGVLKLPLAVDVKGGVDLDKIVISQETSDLLNKVVKDDSLSRPAERLVLLKNGILDTKDEDNKCLLSLAQEALVLDILKDVPGVVKVLDGGLVDGLPYSVQEMAPPALTFEKKTGLEFETDVLDKVLQVAEIIEAVHKKGIALQDFEPNTKWDRIRYDPTTDKISIIDWNVSGGADKILIGGVNVDMEYLGGHLVRYLTGVAPPCLQGKFHEGVGKGNLKIIDLPNRHNVGVGVPGWDDLSDGSRFLITKMMCGDSNFRYQNIGETVIGIRDMQKTFDMVVKGDTDNILDVIWELKRDGKHDEIVMIANMATSNVVVDDPKAYASIKEFGDNAKREVKASKELPLANARGTIMTGSFDKAKDEIQRVMELSVDSEIITKCQLYTLCLDAAINLAKAKGISNADVRNLPRGRDLSENLTGLIIGGKLDNAKSIRPLALNL